jgi:hypothetical protein
MQGFRKCKGNIMPSSESSSLALVRTCNIQMIINHSDTLELDCSADAYFAMTVVEH